MSELLHRLTGKRGKFKVYSDAVIFDGKCGEMTIDIRDILDTKLVRQGFLAGLVIQVLTVKFPNGAPCTTFEMIDTPEKIELANKIFEAIRRLQIESDEREMAQVALDLCERQELERQAFCNRVLRNKRADYSGREFSKHYSYIYDDVRIFIMPSEGFDFTSLECCIPIRLELEPDNGYDPNAVKIMCGNDRIGYLHKGTLQQMVIDWYKVGAGVDAELMIIKHSEVAETREIEILLKFRRKKRLDAPIYKLVGNTSDDTQDFIKHCCKEDSEVLIRYDLIGEKYVALLQDDPIGYLPKSVNAVLDPEDDDGILGFVDSVQTNYDGRKVVTVVLDK